MSTVPYLEELGPSRAMSEIPHIQVLIAALLENNEEEQAVEYLDELGLLDLAVALGMYVLPPDEAA